VGPQEEVEEQVVRLAVTELRAVENPGPDRLKAAVSREADRKAVNLADRLRQVATTAG